MGFLAFFTFFCIFFNKSDTLCVIMANKNLETLKPYSRSWLFVRQPNKKDSSKSQEISNLTLHVGHSWYAEPRQQESKNRARRDSRVTNTINLDNDGQILGTNRSKVSGTLQENVNAVLKKVENTQIPEKKSVACCHMSARIFQSF